MTLHIIVIFVGFLIVNALSIIISHRIKRHIGSGYAAFTFLFVSIAAAYYLADVLIVDPYFYTNIYFYLWLAIVITQLFFFFRAWKASRRARTRTETNSSNV
jgi:hypothetical protein